MNKRKWLAFDIETVEVAPESGDDYALGVTCAATLRSGDEAPIIWAGDIGSDGRYSEQMTPEQVCHLADYLLGSFWQDDFSIIGINSLGFDLRVLAVECQDLLVYDNLRDLALAHYDPAFQMLCERGFMVGMKALGIGLQLQEQKMEEMDGRKAVEMWTGSRADQDKVLEYVAQDARTTLAIVEEVERCGAIIWQTKRGRFSNHRLASGLLTVEECLELPLPDTSWMSDPWPRERFAGWALGAKE
jgi:hypothetical protein